VHGIELVEQTAHTTALLGFRYEVHLVPILPVSHRQRYNEPAPRPLR
jgi:hypothetical protein